VPRNLTAQDRSVLIRLAAALPVGSSERKTILSALSPFMPPKGASQKLLGYIASTDLSGDWGDRLQVYLEGSKVRLRAESWSRVGGIDSSHGAAPPEVRVDLSVPAEPRALLNGIKSVLKDRRLLWLNKAKLKDFLWYLPFSGPKLKGLSAGIVTQALDAWSMSKEVWEATYLKPVAKPTGGPFSFDSSSTMKEISEQLKAQGHPLIKTRAVPGGWNLRHALMLEDGRAYKKLLSLLEASADSSRKTSTSDGHDLFVFDFGGKKINVGKIGFGYPINGTKWAVWD
jgi:hypothetical protein